LFLGVVATAQIKHSLKGRESSYDYMKDKKKIHHLAWVNHVLERDIIVSNVTGRIKEELAKDKVITGPSPKQD
jgi:hypothetical protein